MGRFKISPVIHTSNMYYCQMSSPAPSQHFSCPYRASIFPNEIIKQRSFLNHIVQKNRLEVASCFYYRLMCLLRVLQCFFQRGPVFNQTVAQCRHSKAKRPNNFDTRRPDCSNQFICNITIVRRRPWISFLECSHSSRIEVHKVMLDEERENVDMASPMGFEFEAMDHSFLLERIQRDHQRRRKDFMDNDKRRKDLQNLRRQFCSPKSEVTMNKLEESENYSVVSCHSSACVSGLLFLFAD